MEQRYTLPRIMANMTKSVWYLFSSLMIIGFAFGNSRGEAQAHTLLTPASGRIETSDTMIPMVWNGMVDSIWATPGNWTPPGPPTPTDSVIIDGVTPFKPYKDSIADNAIGALFIGGPAELTLLSPSHLSVLGSTTIANEGKIIVQSNSPDTLGAAVTLNGMLLVDAVASPTITFYNSWIRGPISVFAPGNSTLSFAGSGTLSGNFNNLLVGSSSSMIINGNVWVEDQFTVLDTVKTKKGSTIFINSDEPGALTGAGIIDGGSIHRAISDGQTAPYRFESESTFVQFGGPGMIPSQATMTAYPDANPLNFGTIGVEVPSTINALTNTIQATNPYMGPSLSPADAATPSKWVIARPPPTDPNLAVFMSDALPVRRVYTVAMDGDSSQVSLISFRYDQSEVPPDLISEDSLKLYRLTYVVKVWEGTVDSLWETAGNWNPPGAPGPNDQVIIPGVLLPSLPPSKGPTPANEIAGLLIHQGGTLTILPSSQLSVSGQLTMLDSSVVNVADGDTVFVNHDAHDALSGTGKIIGGSIRRAIQPADTLPYRFESQDTYIQFNGSVPGASFVTFTTHPSTIPPPYQERGDSVPSIINAATNTIETIDPFPEPSNLLLDATAPSKWVIARPPPTEPNRFAADSCAKDSVAVQRVYEVAITGDAGNVARLSFHYEDNEIPSGPEECFNLYRRLLIECADVPLSPGWNLISNPMITPDNSVSALYPTSLFGYAFRFDPSAGYIQDLTLENGTGYWGKFPGTYIQPICGIPYTLLSVPVVGGWNLVGSLSELIDTAQVDDPSGIRASAWFGYSGGYFSSSEILPGSAYWVKATAAGSFILSTAPAPAEKSGLSGENSLEGLNRITIMDKKGATQTLYFGGERSNVNPLFYAMPPLPPSGAFDARFETEDGGSMVHMHPAAAGIRVPIALQTAAYPATVSWTISDGAVYEIANATGGQTRFMQGEGSTSFSGTDRLLLTTTDLAGLPKEYALQQNYPNPFNPTTTIQYQLPVASNISLVVFDILGREVKTLVNQVQTAGYKEQNWDGTNNAGKLVGSGVYFYRLEASGTTNSGKSFAQVRRLLLLK